MFAPTYLANAVLVIGLALKLLGIEITDAALQTTITTLLMILVPLFTLLRQWWTGRSTIYGTRPD